MTVRTLRNIGGGIGLRRRGSSGGLQTVIVLGAGGGDPGSGFYYDRLMQVAINNTFYNVAGSRSLDFAITPTRTTQRLLDSLGMLFRDEGAGFSVLYDTARTEQLLRYLRRRSSAETNVEDDGAETRLSFALTLRNPNFCYFTDIPFDIDSGSECYYASNRMAHDVDGRIVLNELEFVPQSEPLPAVEGQLDVPFPDGATAIEVLDVLGTVVQCYPRVVPIALLDTDPAAINSCAQVSAYLAKHPKARLVAREICTINFYLLPAGFYTIRYVDAAQPAFTVIYRAENFRALCFVDLFLADPVAGGAGIYPVTDLFDPEKTAIVEVDYNLDFQARSTFWEYFFVPPSKGAQLHDLHISGKNGEPVAFTPAEPVPIGLDTMAYFSVSEVPLQIQSSSPYAFKLTGRIQDSKGMIARESTLMARLPVAPPDWALPVDDPSNDTSAPPSAVGPTYGRSAIYVYL